MSCILFRNGILEYIDTRAHTIYEGSEHTRLNFLLRWTYYICEGRIYIN